MLRNSQACDTGAGPSNTTHELTDSFLLPEMLVLNRLGVSLSFMCVARTAFTALPHYPAWMQLICNPLEWCQSLLHSLGGQSNRHSFPNKCARPLQWEEHPPGNKQDLHTLPANMALHPRTPWRVTLAVMMPHTCTRARTHRHAHAHRNTHTHAHTRVKHAVD